MRTETAAMAGEGSSMQTLHDPLLGTGYRPLRRIGAGASSEVFEALSPDRVRRAVKVLRSGFVDDLQACFRLEQEGLALSAIEHENLVPVVDAGITAAGRPFFVMPLLAGETLRDALTRCGRLAPHAALAIAIDMLHGLDAAHSVGVIHRDIKPGNLFLPALDNGVRHRHCMVLDFGIAKVLGARSGPTTESHILGTPRYLAPEQIVGGEVDARTDVYSAGLTLFEMLAGRGPYEVGGPIDAMRSHLDATPLPLRDLVNVSHELAHAVARSIEKSPARRWPSARAFAAVLARSAGQEPQGTPRRRPHPTASAHGPFAGATERQVAPR